MLKFFANFFWSVSFSLRLESDQWRCCYMSGSPLQQCSPVNFIVGIPDGLRIPSLPFVWYLWDESKGFQKLKWQAHWQSWALTTGSNHYKTACTPKDATLGVITCLKLPGKLHPVQNWSKNWRHAWQDKSKNNWEQNAQVHYNLQTISLLPNLPQTLRIISCSHSETVWFLYCLASVNVSL